MTIKNIQDIVLPASGSVVVVFVSGVTGQDGSHMVDYLLKNVPNAIIIGGVRRLSVDNHKNIAHLEGEPRFQLVNFDLTDSHSIYKLMECAQPDYFINFAAQSFVASSWDFARQTWQTNSTAILDCLEAIKRVKPTCRFYNAGSSEEFGNVAYSPQDEKHPARPRSPYGASKAAARTLIKVYRESYGIYAVQGWLFNHEGTRRGEQFVTRKITKAVNRIWKEIKINKAAIPNVTPLELGNIDAKRDWSDAEDMVDAVWRMLNQEVYGSGFFEPLDDIQTRRVNNETEYLELLKKKIVPFIKDYVCSSNETHTIRDFIERAFDEVGIKGYWTKKPNEPLTEQYQLIDHPNIILVKINPQFYRPAEVETLMGDSSEIRKDLGWNPKTSFTELITKMVKNDTIKQ